jgi:CO/xanthine dehydrogenase FAD-binding subunit
LIILKPAPFRYEVPKSEEELLDILSTMGDHGKILAGGQSLIQMMNLRLIQPKVLVDINRIEEYRYIRDDGDYFAIGPLVRHQDLLEDRNVRKWCPMIVKAAHCIGHRAIRNRGTVIGSIAQADPNAELPAVITSLGCELIVLDSITKEQTSEVRFFVGRNKNSLASHQFLREIRIRKLYTGEGQSFKEFSIRQNDLPVAGAAVSIRVDRSNCIIEAKGALLGLSEIPVYFEKEAYLLIGATETPHRFQEAASYIVNNLNQAELNREYHREVVEHLLVQAFKEAFQEACLNQ